MTFAQLTAEVFRRLFESSTAPRFWSETDVQTAIGDGYAEMSDATGWYERSITVDLLHTRPWYDLRDVIGPSCLALGPTFNVTTNRWLTPTTVRQLDGDDRRWERNEGQPQRVMVQGLWWMGVWPRVASDSGTLTQYYTALPPALSAATDEPGFPAAYHMGIVDCALTDLWAEDGETRLAMQAWERYLAMETRLQLWVDTRGGGARTHGYGRVTGIPS